MIVTPPGDEHAYEQIEAAVMETHRGRWFLGEYARRHRHSDTMMVLEAIEKLQRNLGVRATATLPLPTTLPLPAALPYDRLQGDIMEMARAIANTEREIRALRPEAGTATQFVSASDQLDGVVETTEKAASAILSAAEKVQEYAWTMREQNGNIADCDMLDSCATEIYTACGFQDLTAQRIHKVVETLRFLDARLKSILEVTGLAEDFHADEKMIDEMGMTRPARPSQDIWMSEANQAEIDDTFEFFVPAAVETSEPTMIGADLMDLDLEPVPKPAAKKKSKTVAASPYDALSTEEKLRAFR
jgi:chemotaxis regulatin CheY-phosphate phosphatase CheZ